MNCLDSNMSQTLKPELAVVLKVVSRDTGYDLYENLQDNLIVSLGIIYLV